jgi:adenylate cyclase
VEVFDRGQDFDPRLDPIVRVEAGRLRAKLQEYYEGGGQSDPVRIVFRKGSYAPTFEAATPAAILPAGSQQRLKWAAVAIVVIGVVAAGLFLIRSGTSAGSEVITIPAIPSADSGNAEFADGLAEAVSMELSKNPGIRVVAWPVVAEYRTRMGAAEMASGRIARDLGVEAVLEVSVRQDQDQRRIAALLINPERGWKEWAGEYERGTGDSFAVQRELARAIAEEVRIAAPKVRAQQK